MLKYSSTGLSKAARDALEFRRAVSDENGVTISAQHDKSIRGFELRAAGNELRIRYDELSSYFRALSYAADYDGTALSITESPVLDTCGIMVDCSRNAVPTVETLKRMLLHIALMGCNRMYLYLEDTYEIKDEPYFGYMRGRYHASELRELISAASEYGIQVIPCIQTLAHLRRVLHWSEYRPIRDLDDVLLVDCDDTYALIEKMIKTSAELFGKHIHLGMDEAELTGLGKHLEQLGYEDRHAIISRHLNRVIGICARYGVKPMIWSDMFFGSSGIQFSRNEFGEVDSSGIPEDLELVYWDYYNSDSETYKKHLTNHKQVNNSIVFAGGAWKWTGIVPHNGFSMRATRCAMKECFSFDIKDAFVTMWGDDGAEASLFSPLPAVSLFAELRFNPDITDKQLSARFYQCTGESLADFMLLDMPDKLFGESKRMQNPSKYLLFQDIMLGLFDTGVPENAEEFYRSLNEHLNLAASRSGSYGYVFNSISAVCSVLSFKAQAGKRIKAAYDANDLKKLKSEVMTLQKLEQRIKTLCQYIEEQWFAENKPFGYEVIDSRMATLARRTEYARKRITDYANGKLSRLAELEETRLPYSKLQASSPGDFTCAMWSEIFSAAEK